MKYCLYFDELKNKNIISKENEILISYKEEDTNLLDICRQYSEQRIVIDISNFYLFKESDGIKKIQGLKEVLPHTDIVLRIFYNKEDCLLLQKNNLPFFCNKFANTWEIFNGLLNLGVTDIYVTEELGFNITKCAEIAHSKNIFIRVFPDVAQSTWYGTQEEIKKFFIRPDDLIQYEPYVDVLEFVGHTDRQEIIYEIYKKQRWAGPINEIIKDLSINVDNRTIIPRFAQNRLNCEKKCQKGSSCNICPTILQLANSLKEKNIVIKNKKLDTKGLLEKEK